jgi:putative serine protease PepD
MNRSHPLLVAAAALAIALVGAGLGAGLYAKLGSGGTTTVLNSVTTVDHGQQIAATSGLTVSQIYQRTIKGVVDITVRGTSSFSFGGGGGGGQGSTAEGSGFVYDTNGHIVTNQHVVSGGGKITVRFWNGQKYSAHVVGTDPSTDLAVIKVDAPTSLLHPLSLGNSDAVQVGDGVVAIGSPFGLPGSVTSGIVSALHRQMTSPSGFSIDDSIQTDAPINHGNSGGPLLNASGQVIGVNAQIQSESGGSDGVGFAIPANTIRSIASQLAAGHAVKHAYIGVSVDDSTNPAGALIGGITAGTPAARAGFHCNDVITKIGNTTVASSDDVTTAIAGKKPGDTVTFTYVRNGSKHTVSVTLASRPNTTSSITSAC